MSWFEVAYQYRVHEQRGELSWTRNATYDEAADFACRLQQLGRNLAVAGALTRSYQLADIWHRESAGTERGMVFWKWEPNIDGKEAPHLPPGTDDTGRGA